MRQKRSSLFQTRAVPSFRYSDMCFDARGGPEVVGMKWLLGCFIRRVEVGGWDRVTPSVAGPGRVQGSIFGPGRGGPVKGELTRKTADPTPPAHLSAGVTVRRRPPTRPTSSWPHVAPPPRTGHLPPG